MGRPKQKINAERGKRLKMLLNDQGITQLEFSKRIHLSQQVISKIIQGKAQLTDDRAKQIIDLFPDYNLQWLLGYAHKDEKTLEDAEYYQLLSNKMIDELKQREKDEFLDCVYKLSEQFGYFFDNSNEGITVSQGSNYSGLIVSNSKSAKSVTINETIFNEFLDDVSDFFITRLNKLIERGH